MSWRQTQSQLHKEGNAIFIAGSDPCCLWALRSEKKPLVISNKGQMHLGTDTEARFMVAEFTWCLFYLRTNASEKKWATNEWNEAILHLSNDLTESITTSIGRRQQKAVQYSRRRYFFPVDLSTNIMKLPENTKAFLMKWKSPCRKHSFPTNDLTENCEAIKIGGGIYREMKNRCSSDCHEWHKTYKPCGW